MKAILQCTAETKVFESENGKKIEYVDLTVIVKGINLKLKANDATAKEILKNYVLEVGK